MIDLTELQALVEKYLDTLDDHKKYENYTTLYGYACIELKGFLEWLKEHQEKEE